MKISDSPINGDGYCHEAKAFGCEATRNSVLSTGFGVLSYEYQEPSNSNFDCKSTYPLPPLPPFIRIIGRRHPDDSIRFSFVKQRGSVVSNSEIPSSNEAAGAIPNHSAVPRISIVFQIIRRFRGVLLQLARCWSLAEGGVGARKEHILELPAHWERQRPIFLYIYRTYQPISNLF